MWSEVQRVNMLCSLPLHTVVSQRSLKLEFKTPAVVCPVCLSYQPMLRCLLTLTSIVLIQSFHSLHRLPMGCGCEQGTRSLLLYSIQQPKWTHGYKRHQGTDVRILYLVNKDGAFAFDLRSLVAVHLLQCTHTSSLQPLGWYNVT